MSQVVELALTALHVHCRPTEACSLPFGFLMDFKRVYTEALAKADLAPPSQHEIGYLVDATLAEAALAGVTLDASNRRDLAQLLKPDPASPEPMDNREASEDQIASVIRAMIGADPKDDRRYAFGDLIRPLQRPSEAAAALYDAGLRATPPAGSTIPDRPLDTDAEVRKVIGFLRSCIYSGERLSAQDEDWIARVLGRLATEAEAPVTGEK